MFAIETHWSFEITSFSSRCLAIALPVAVAVACLFCSRPTSSKGKAEEARLDLQAIFTLSSTIRRKGKKSYFNLIDEKL